MYSKTERFKLENILQENFFYDDNSWSMKKFNNLSESKKIDLTNKISGNILKSIRNKINKSDFKSIDNSKGDFIKLEGYKDIMSCSDFLKKLSIDDNLSTVDFKQSIIIVENSINFLIKRKNDFKKGFSSRNNLVMYLYKSEIVSIVTVLNLIISNCITVESDKYNFRIKANNNYKNNICENSNTKSLNKILDLEKNDKLNEIFNLEILNENCNNILSEDDKLDMSGIVNDKNIDNMSSFIKKLIKDGLMKSNAGKNIINHYKNNKTKISGISDKNKKILGITILVLISIITVIFILRQVIYYYYASRIKFSEYLNNISEMVELNTVSLGNDEKSQKIREKQLKYSETLKKLSDKININDNIANEQKNKEIEKQDKEISNSNLPVEDEIF